MKAVISDYNWLGDQLRDAWFYARCSDYLIYDRYHRDCWKNNPNVIFQRNVGQNIYDLLDFIVNNYHDLPSRTFFARGCLIYPKGRKKPLSNGNCSLNVLDKKLSQAGDVIEIHDYGEEDVDGKFSFMFDGGYCESVSSWWFRFHKGRYYFSFHDFLNDILSIPLDKDFVRFSPGASYILSKQSIRQYPIEVYVNLRYLVSWGIIVGEAHLLERFFYEFFSQKLIISDLYKLPICDFKKCLTKRRFNTFIWNNTTRLVLLMWSRIRSKCL